MPEEATQRRTCRACGGAALQPVLSLGEQALTCFPQTPDEAVRRGPLDLVLCRDCSLLQLAHSFPPAWLYAWYGYRSGMNASMRAALRELAETAGQVVGLRTDDVVVDIGSNDGEFLRNFGAGITKVGYEPAENLREEAARGIDVLIPSFFSAAEYPFRRKAKLATAVAMFYDLDNPMRFLDDVRAILAPDGLFVVQMNYLPLMLKSNGYDSISHEHVCYYSLSTLKLLLERAGLEPFDVETNGVNGGSFRVYIRHRGSPLERQGGKQRLRAMLKTEWAWRLGERAIYDAFAVRVATSARQLAAFVRTAAAQGQSVYVYGASTRGLVIMQYCGLDGRFVRGAAERNPEKWGRYYSATGIPCVSEEEARAKADWFLALPYHFIDEFVERERAFLGRGGGLIVPLPEFRVISLCTICAE